MSLTSIEQLKNLMGKRVLVRVDWNVPVKNKKIQDDFKILRSLATIRYLLNAGARVILVTHVGRPKKNTSEFSVKPIAKYAEKLLGTRIKVMPFVKKNEFKRVQSYIEQLAPRAIAMLENIRFSKDEESDAGTLAKDLARLADVFVLDGFAVAHRAAASVTGVARYLPTYAGLLLSEEVNVLSGVTNNPKTPLVVVLGGAKADTKIPVLKNLIKKADYILLGGGLVNTYLWATGHGVGKSIVAPDFAKEIVRFCSKKQIILPVDVVVGKDDGSSAEVVSLENVLQLPKTKAIYDIGPETIKMYSQYIKKAKTLVWNGAMGMFEVPEYGYGTKALACLFAARSRGRALGVAGGGETVELIRDLGLMSSIDLVSTGGGAMLEFMSGNKLPGVSIITK